MSAGEVRDLSERILPHLTQSDVLKLIEFADESARIALGVQS